MRLLLVARNFNAIRNLHPRVIRQKMAQQYPQVRRADVKDLYHGVEMQDPYRWLEDPDDAETKQFLDAQNVITRPYIDDYTHRDDLKQSITDMWNYPKHSTPGKRGDKYYQFVNSGLQNQRVLYVMDALDGKRRVFLEPNLLSHDGTIALTGTNFFEDGKTMAYSLSSSGSNWNEIKFENAETGDDYEDVLAKVKFSSMCWMHDNVGFFYSAYIQQEGQVDGSETASNEYHKLYYHKLGTTQSEDILVVEFNDPQLLVTGTVSFCGRYLVVSAAKGCKNNLLYYAKLDSDIDGKLSLQPIVEELEADYSYITNDGSEFIFRTNRLAPNYKLIVIDFKNSDESNWLNLVAESKHVLDWCFATSRMPSINKMNANYKFRIICKIPNFKLCKTSATTHIV